MQSQQEQQDQKITIRIKKFLTKDSGFRNASFDPAPFLINILKQKQANQQGITQKQNQLISLQNQAQQLIKDICTQYENQFGVLLKIPQQYGRQLERLKSNISVVKKKAKQTRNYLNQTQKDIQKIHLNCIYNKIIYKKLKQIQLKLHQYQAASIALKNNQFMACSLHLQHLKQSNSILQNTLNQRAQILNLRLLSRAIQQITIFAYFTPKVILPSTNILLQRPNHQNQATILNWNQHQAFYKRYHLFKKAYCQDYLRQIWKFDDLERKSGKIGIIFDVIKAVVNSCKIQEVSETLQLDCKKSIQNIFLLLQFFFIKQPEFSSLQGSSYNNQNGQNYLYQKNLKQKPSWFFDGNPQFHKNFISTVLCICGAVFRKLIIIRKIYKQFVVSTLKFNSGHVFTIVIQQLRQLLQILYFPSIKKSELYNLGQSDKKNSMKQQKKQQGQNAIDHLPKEIKDKILGQSNFIYFGYVTGMIKKALLTLIQNLNLIEEDQFGIVRSSEINQVNLKFLDNFTQLFYKEFNKEFHKSLEQIFQLEGRPFTVQLFETIISIKNFSEDDIKHADGYKSDEKKAIKQHILLVSFLRGLGVFFKTNSLSQYKYYRYSLFILTFFYLKVYTHISRFIILQEQLNKIEQIRKRQKKIKVKQQSFFNVYYKLATQNENSKSKTGKKATTSLNQKVQCSFSDFNLIDRLKVFKRQNQMLLAFSMHQFQYIQEYKSHESIKDYIENLQKLEAGSYDQNIQAKFIRIWDKLPQGQTGVKVATAAVFRKFINLHLNICAKIYIETGNYL